MISNETPNEDKITRKSMDSATSYGSEAIEVFSTKIFSLTEDITVLQQLASLALVGRTAAEQEHRNEEKNSSQTQQQFDGTNDKNIAESDNGINNDSETIETTVGIMNEFRNIEKLVTALETQMSELQSFVKDEIQALKALEGVKKAAEGQRELIDEMRRGCNDITLPGEHLLCMSPERNVSQAEKELHYKRNKKESTIGFNQSKKVRSVGQRNTTNKMTPNIKMTPVTQTELTNVCKSIRGRITLSVLNDALKDIERVARNKYAILNRRQHVGKNGNISSKGSNTSIIDGKPQRVSKRLYFDTLNLHQELSMEEHGKHPWVSEKELREFCNFFRSGESTARNILLVLRSVKRLKQVCGGQTQITYMCL